MASNSAKILACMKEFLNDGRAHSVAEITRYVKEHCPDSGRFTSGMYSGAFYTLVHNSNGRYINPERGQYQMVVEPENLPSTSRLQENILTILKNTCISLRGACTGSLINVSESDLALANKVSHIIDQLETACDEINREFQERN